jgi:hypothetical protein
MTSNKLSNLLKRNKSVVTPRSNIHVLILSFKYSTPALKP